MGVAGLLLAGSACANSFQSQAKDIGGVPLTEGSAHVDITGAQEISFDAPLDKAQVGTAVTVFLYRSNAGDLFSITGLGIKGTAKTTSSLVLAVTTGDLAAGSEAGECTITVHAGDGDSQSGTATCTHLDSNQGTIALKARFSATP